jgi:DNA-binding CsgD family transcriptional regulator
MGKPDKKQIAEMVVLNDLGKSARQIGAQMGHSPNTVLKYLRSSELLDDPKVKELVAKMWEHEADSLMLLGGKAQARLHEKVDDNKLKPIELIALMDRSFTQRRLLEGKSTANLALRGIVKIQNEALEKTIKDLSKSGKAEGENQEQDTGGPRTRQKQTANASTPTIEKENTEAVEP